MVTFFSALDKSRDSTANCLNKCRPPRVVQDWASNAASHFKLSVIEMYESSSMFPKSSLRVTELKIRLLEEGSDLTGIGKGLFSDAHVILVGKLSTQPILVPKFFSKLANE